MKVTGKKSLSTLIEICLKIIFVVGILIYITLPLLLNWYIDIFNPILNYTAALIILYASGIPALIIVYKFIKIFKPFTLENVRHLNVISICSLIIAIEYAIGIFFIVSIFEVILIAVFIIIWLGAYILAELLRKAVEYKEENDLTI